MAFSSWRQMPTWRDVHCVAEGVARWGEIPRGLREEYRAARKGVARQRDL